MLNAELLEEPVGAIIRGSTTTVEVVLDFTNSFLHGAAPKTTYLVGLQPEPALEMFFSPTKEVVYLLQTFLMMRLSP